MQRAAIYVRVGTVPHADQAVDNQLAVCREYCRRWRLPVVCEFIDVGFRGTAADRPAFASLIASALDLRRDFDVIVVMDRSRFSEDAGFAKTYEDLLLSTDIALKPVSWETVRIPFETETDLPAERQRSYYPAVCDGLPEPVSA
jgi:hypothetical protein